MNKHKGDGLFFNGADDSACFSDSGHAGSSLCASMDDSVGIPVSDSACARADAPDTGCTSPCYTDPCVQGRTGGRSAGLSDGMSDAISVEAGVKQQTKAPHKSMEEGDTLSSPATLPPLRGLVLAGGLSSRLGHDKANLKIHSDIGITDLLDRSMRVLRLVVDNIAVVGRNAEGYPSIPDLVTRKGPVGGIASALAAFPGDAVLVLSCDLPFMNASILRKLLKARAEAPANTLMTAYRQAETGHKEALVAIYEPGAAGHFLESLYADKLKVSMVVPEEQQFFIEYGAEDSLPFFNINYPADLEVVKRLIEVVHAED